MKKIIWIYGGPQTGKTLFTEQLTDLLFGKITAKVDLSDYKRKSTPSLLEPPFHICDLIIIDSFHVGNRRDLKKFDNIISQFIQICNEGKAQLVIISQHPPVKELEEYVIQLKAELPAYSKLS